MSNIDKLTPCLYFITSSINGTVSNIDVKPFVSDEVKKWANVFLDKLPIDFAKINNGNSKEVRIDLPKQLNGYILLVDDGNSITFSAKLIHNKYLHLDTSFDLYSDIAKNCFIEVIIDYLNHIASVELAEVIHKEYDKNCRDIEERL